MSALRVEKTCQKKRIERLTRHLAKELPARERNVTEKRHTEDAVAEKGKLSKQVNQLSLRVNELEGEVVKGKKTAANLKMLNDFGAWMTKRIFEGQQTYLRAFKPTIDN